MDWTGTQCCQETKPAEKQHCSVRTAWLSQGTSGRARSGNDATVLASAFFAFLLLTASKLLVTGWIWRDDDNAWAGMLCGQATFRVPLWLNEVVAVDSWRVCCT